MSKINDAEAEYYTVLRVALISFIKGFPPILAVETARRSIPSACRPTFSEMEKNCKSGAAAAPPAAAA
jgi:chemotaxis protein MotA